MMNVNPRIISRDIRFFVLAFIIAITMGFIPFQPARIAIAICLLMYYGFYVYKHATDTGHASEGDAEDISPLHFRRKSADPPLATVIIQSIAGVALIVGAAYLFVQYVSDVATSVGITPLVLSLI